MAVLLIFTLYTLKSFDLILILIDDLQSLKAIHLLKTTLKNDNLRTDTAYLNSELDNV